MKFQLNRALLLALLAAGWLVASGCAFGQPAVPETEPTTAPVGQAAPTAAAQPAAPTPATLPTEGVVRLPDGTVIATGRVEPANVVTLGFEAPGTVAEVLVEAGDTVEAGDPLARLDTRRLELDIEQARASLAEARAGYEELLAGASPEDIARAQADIDEARARLAASSSDVTKEEIAAAQAELREAQAVSNLLRAGPKAQDLAILQAAIDNAQARLQTRRDQLAADKLRIETQVDRASNNIKDLQDIYSRIYWINKNKADGGGSLSQNDIDAEAAALRDVQNAERARDELLLSLEEARKNEVTEIAAYETDVRAAQARLDKALLPPEADEVAAAEKRVLQAQARLADLRGARREYDQAALGAVVRQAEATYAALTADPTTSDLASAEARLARAEVVLKQAELNIDRVTIHSPISGTVAQVNIEPGQVAQIEDNAFLVADMSDWLIVSEDLNELNISQIREGDSVLIRFFALPDLELPGEVKFIETVGRETNLGTSYTATVIPEQWDDRLRWNMTAQVWFIPGQ